MIKPAYRRGPGFRKGTLRLSRAVWEALAAEATRRHQWMSDVAQQLLAEGLQRVDRAPQPEPSPAPPASARSRRTCHLAVDGSVWEALQVEARRDGLSVAQVIRQRLAEIVAQAPDRTPMPHDLPPVEVAAAAPAHAAVDGGRARHAALAPSREAGRAEGGDAVPDLRRTPQPLTVFEW